jgi:signal peptidase I
MNFLRKHAKTLALVGLIFVVRGTFADHFYVPSGSMEPTIHIGDFVLTNKMAYDLRLPYSGVVLKHLGEPQRGDIVVFYGPADGKRLIKRFVGVPGDHVVVGLGEVRINGELMGYAPTPNERADFIIPKDRYYAMGDNRGNSLDSRYWGLVPRENIVARAHHVAVNISRFGHDLE